MLILSDRISNIIKWFTVPVYIHVSGGGGDL